MYCYYKTDDMYLYTQNYSHMTVSSGKGTPKDTGSKKRARVREDLYIFAIYWQKFGSLAVLLHQNVDFFCPSLLVATQGFSRMRFHHLHLEGEQHGQLNQLVLIFFEVDQLPHDLFCPEWHLYNESKWSASRNSAKSLLKGNLVIKNNLLQLLHHPLSEMSASGATTWQPGNIDIWTVFEHMSLEQWQVLAPCTFYLRTKAGVLWGFLRWNAETWELEMGPANGHPALYWL